jgi:hypothetical protein
MIDKTRPVLECAGKRKDPADVLARLAAECRKMLDSTGIEPGSPGGGFAVYDPLFEDLRKLVKEAEGMPPVVGQPEVWPGLEMACQASLANALWKYYVTDNSPEEGRCIRRNYGGFGTAMEVAREVGSFFAKWISGACAWDACDDQVNQGRVAYLYNNLGGTVARFGRVSCLSDLIHMPNPKVAVALQMCLVLNTEAAKDVR